MKNGTDILRLLSLLLCAVLLVGLVPGAAWAKVVGKAPGAAASSSGQASLQAAAGGADNPDLCRMRAGADSDTPGYWTGVMLVGTALLVIFLAGTP